MPTLKVVVLVLVLWVPMGGLGVPTPPRFFLTLVHGQLDLRRRPLSPRPPVILALCPAIVLLLRRLLLARPWTTTRVPVGRAPGSGILHGSTYHMLVWVTEVSSSRLCAAVNGGGSTARLPTSVTVTPPMADLAMFDLDTFEMAITLPQSMHQFGGAMGKAARLGRVCRSQLEGWDASLGPTMTTARRAPLRLWEILRGLAPRQRLTPAFPPWPRPSSSTPIASLPNGRGRASTTAHRALPTASRRCGGALPPGQPLPLPSLPTLTLAATMPPRTRPLGSRSTLCLPQLLAIRAN
jgi:hypothetical protein